MKASLLMALLIVCSLSCKKKKSDVPANTIQPLGARFTVTGTMQDMGSTLFQGYYPFEITLTKSSATQATMVPTLLGIPGHVIASGSSTSFYSNFGPTITLDASTNKITAMTNSYGQPSNGRSATLDPSGVNAWNPTTKEIKIKYWMDEPAVTTPHRVSFNETWTYIP